MLRLLGLALAVPDHTTLSRRGRDFAGRQPRAARHDGPVHLVLESTGLQLFGRGEWDAEKHGHARRLLRPLRTRDRPTVGAGIAKRRWRKLLLAADATNDEIAAHVLTDGNADDAAQLPALLRQANGPSRA